MVKRQRIEGSFVDSLCEPLGNANPFLVFPEEVWLLIMQEIRDQSTLQCVITALPEFSKSFQKYFKFYEFSQVSPRVFEYQANQQISLNPVKFGSNWCVAFANFLEYNPIIRVEDGEKKTKSAVSSSEYNFCTIKKTQADLPLLFTTTWQILRYVKTRNPSDLTTSSVKFCRRTQIDSLEYINVTAAFLAKFGKQLRHVTLEFGNVTQWRISFDTTAFVYDFVKCLANIPNVRTLSVGFSAMEHALIDFHLSKYFEVPVLPYLESVDIVTGGQMKNILFEFLMKGCINNGRIRAIRAMYEENNIHGVVEYKLQHIENNESRLRKLNAKCLELSDKPNNGFEFLKHMPSLQYLYVKSHAIAKRGFIMGTSPKNDYFTKLIRSYLYDKQVPEEFNIWEKFPSLKALIVERQGKPCKYFVRCIGTVPVLLLSSV